MDHSELSSMLGQRFAEKLIARGLSANGRMVEIYATDDGATWTMESDRNMAMLPVGILASWTRLT